MKITALMENTSARGLSAEHGLSLFVDMGDRRFLFDMGQTARFAENARALGIDLNAADFAVLSHGHYDHGGGLATFLALNDHAPVYLSRRAFEPHYNAADACIGLDEGLKGAPRLVFMDDGLEIAPGVTLVSAAQVPLYGDPGAFGLKVLRHGRLEADDFLHEQYLLVERDGRRVLFSGCSHRGILNIVRRFEPDVLVGGFHLFKLPVGAALDGYADALEAANATYYTCHCTGAAQYEYMKRRMTRLHYLSAGDAVEV